MIARFTYFAVWLSCIKWSFWSLPMISLCCILSLQLGTWSWNLLCYMSLRMWHGQYSSHFMSQIFSVLYLHRKAHALCTSYSVSRNLRPVILDGNSYIDSLSNHWSTYAIAHARFRDTEYEVPALTSFSVAAQAGLSLT